jgi:hypothetical protein
MDTSSPARTLLSLIAMTREYPVHVEVTSPPVFDRMRLLLRVVIAIVLSFLGITGGWIATVLYAVLPVCAALLIISHGSERFLADDGPRLWRALAWLLELSAFMLMLVDDPPGGSEHRVKIACVPQGKPTLANALTRLLTSIPSALVLGLLWCLSCIVWIVAAVLVVVRRTIPPSILGFQRSVLRWQARLVAYHASLVDEYPPFELDTSDGHETPAAAASV